MKTIKVVKAFTLNLEDKSGDLSRAPTKIHFPVGTHEVENDIADHWYTKAHTEGFLESNPDFLATVKSQANVVISKPLEQKAKEDEEKKAEAADKKAK